jgi:hypothetical protein
MLNKCLLLDDVPPTHKHEHFLLPQLAQEKREDATKAQAEHEAAEHYCHRRELTQAQVGSAAFAKGGLTPEPPHSLDGQS